MMSAAHGWPDAVWLPNILTFDPARAFGSPAAAQSGQFIHTDNQNVFQQPPL